MNDKKYLQNSDVKTMPNGIGSTPTPHWMVDENGNLTEVKNKNKKIKMSGVYYDD